MSQGSRDNMSLVLITLPGAPAVSEEAVKREQLLEELIEKKVTGNIFTRFGVYCLLPYRMFVF